MRHHIIADLVSRALQDPAFRAALEADPQGVVTRELAQRETGLSLPAVKVRLVQQAPDEVVVVLPAATELSDEQLAGIAGGGGMPVYESSVTVMGPENPLLMTPQGLYPIGQPPIESSIGFGR